MKAAIDKYELKGDHYNQKQGRESDFNKSIKLDWIPRYMVVNPEGKITLYKAIKADDKRISKVLNN